MIEAGIAVLGGWVAVCGILTIRSQIKNGEGIGPLHILGAITNGAGVLYFAVRFIHWAWDRPIPLPW